MSGLEIVGLGLLALVILGHAADRMDSAEQYKPTRRQRKQWAAERLQQPEWNRLRR